MRKEDDLAMSPEESLEDYAARLQRMYEAHMRKWQHSLKRTKLIITVQAVLIVLGVTLAIVTGNWFAIVWAIVSLTWAISAFRWQQLHADARLELISRALNEEHK